MLHSHVGKTFIRVIPRPARGLRTFLTWGITCLFLTTTPLLAQTTTTVRWATGAFGNQAGVNYAPSRATRLPDGKTSVVSRANWLYLVGFNVENEKKLAEGSYELESKLGLPAGELQKWDVIAFEGNQHVHGAVGGGWES